MDGLCLIRDEFFSTEKNFENIVKYISNRSVILGYRSVMGIFYNESTYSLANTKIFLTMYLLKYVPEEIVNVSNEDSKEIIDKSCKLLTLFDTILKRYSGSNVVDVDLVGSFVRNFNSFVVEYKKWKEEDITAFLYNAVVVTHDMNLTLNYIENKEKQDSDSDSDSELMISTINKQIDDVHKHVISLNLDSRFIKEYNDYLIEQKLLMMREEISEIAKNAYYSLMEENIKSNEFEMLESFLVDLKEELRKILPKNKEFNRNLNFDESFDTDLIIQMIKHSAFEKEDFLKLFEYFFDLFMKIQPAEEDSAFIKWKILFIEKMDSEDFTRIIIDFLHYYMDKIEVIQQKMIDFYNKLKEMDSVD
jgi:hypothetical protein